MTSNFMLAHRGDKGVLQRTDMICEVKLDGTRVHIKKSATGFEMWSRNSKDNSYSVNYAEVGNLPEVAHDVRGLVCKSVWLDAELVWFNQFGRSVMRGSQVRCGTKRRQAIFEKMSMYPINAVVFDLLELNGQDFTQEPFMVRKAMLKAFIAEQDELKSLRYLDYTFDKQSLWEQMLKLGGEGIMAKTLDGTYEFRRTRSWLKLKTEKTAIKQVVGYTSGLGEREPFFGSLVMMNEDGTPCGNVGGGFNRQELEWWTEQLKTAQRIEKPFSDKEVGASYIAVRIPFKVKVRYLEVSRRGILRFPVYLNVI